MPLHRAARHQRRNKKKINAQLRKTKKFKLQFLFECSIVKMSFKYNLLYYILNIILLFILLFRAS